jgi:A/G-specific adenine glycosylase
MENQLQRIVPPLLFWYAAHARVLPWRDEPTPYRVWVSEIMLQQTRVEAVKPYFERFLAELPSIEALANASEDQLLKLWEGLGYYSRVRNLHKAAQLVMERFGGNLPSTREELLQLPGIGDYTAGAIASIAYGKPFAAVDGNVLRVIARVTAVYDNVSEQAVKKRIAKQLEEIYPAARAGDFTQSLMELGATVCLPNSPPKCGECPLKELCSARLQGIAEELPVKNAKKERKIEERTVFLLVHDGKAAIVRRADSGLLAGLWEFPSVSGALSPQQTQKLLKTWELSAVKTEILPNAKHIFTHIEWRMTGYLIAVNSFGRNDAFIWATPAELLEQYTVPTAFKSFLNRFLKPEDDKTEQIRFF